MDNLGFFEIFAGGLALFYAGIKSYGVAIILLTLLVRVVLLPLTIKQTKSMREMQVIQPQVKKLQAKYKGNRQKMNEEMMALYKEHGVNPLGGCLPLLMQFPVLIALFQVLRSPLKYLGGDTALAGDLMEKALSVNRFLGIRLDCYPSDVLAREGSDAIPGVSCGSGLVSFLPYLALILLMGFTTYYQQRQMQASRGAADTPQAQQMQTFMKIMPLIFMVFAFNFPTGLAVYWVTTNLWTIVQQRIILKSAPLPEPGAKGKDGTKAGGTKAGGTKAAGKGGTKGKATGSSTKGAKGGNTKRDKIANTGASSKGGSPNGAKGKGSKPQPAGSGGSRSRPSSKKKRR